MSPTHPELNKKGLPKKKYLELHKNPNPEDLRTSYLNIKLRKNIELYFKDTGRVKLTIKRKWSVSKKDKRIIIKLDKNKL